MKLNSLFPKESTLASKPKKEKEVEKVDPVKKAKIQARKKNIVPGRGVFNINWPTIEKQQPKDYQVITTAVELEKYLRKCERTGVGSLDWETAPSDKERKRWEDYKKDWKARKAAAEAEDNKSLIKNLEKEFEKKENSFRYSPLDPHKGKICTFSIAATPHEARVVFIDHKEGKRNFEPELSRDQAREKALNLLENYVLMNDKVVSIAYNLKFETKFAIKYGKYLLKPVADPMVMAIRCQQVVAPKKIKNKRVPYIGKGLKNMTKEYFGVKMTEFTQLLKDHNIDFFDELSTDDPAAVEYSAEDSDYALQLYYYWKEVAKQIPNKNERYPTYLDWLNEIEMPFMRVIGQMEYWGMKANKDLFREKRHEAAEKQEEKQEIIKEIAKDTFDIEVEPGKSGKTKDVKSLIFDKMKIPAAKWSDKTGNPSLDKYAIQDMIFMLENKLNHPDEEKYLNTELPDDWEERDPETDGELTKAERMAIRIKHRDPHPYQEEGIKLLETLQDIQKYSTLLSSHIKGREKYIHEVTGRIHAEYTPWTRTSRLNSSKPNGQNVPRPDNDEFGVRDLYQADEGKIFLFIDFSGFELRLMAWKSGDETMTEIFRTGGDMHRKTAATLTGKPEEEITKEERTHAKPGNFSISYGGTEHAIQSNFRDYGLRKSLEECKEVYDAVVNTYPRIPEYQQEMITIARDQGYVETIYGYKRLLPDINSTNKYNRQKDERRASNTPIQGSAADIMKRAQNDVYDKIARDGLHGKVDQVAQIHDEIIFELDEDPELVKSTAKWANDIMEEDPLPDFPLKIKVDDEVGYKWGSKMDLEEWLEGDK